MNIGKEMLQKYNEYETSEEKILFVREILGVIHKINISILSDLKTNGINDERQIAEKTEKIENWTKNIFVNTSENIKIEYLLNINNEKELLESQLASYNDKVERAKELLAEKEHEISITQKATVNKIKKDLQLSRDTLKDMVDITDILGNQLSTNEEIENQIGSINNIRRDIRYLVDEFSNNGLWDENEDKPVAMDIALPEKEVKSKPKSKAKQTSSKTKKKKAETQTEENVIPNIMEIAEQNEGIENLECDNIDELLGPTGPEN